MTIEADITNTITLKGELYLATQVSILDDNRREYKKILGITTSIFDTDKKNVKVIFDKKT